MRTQKSVLRKIREELIRRPEVLAAYVFGSKIKGYARENSDLDVAILVDPDFEIEDYGYQIKIEEELNQLAEGLEIDVVVVNSVGLPLQYAAAVQGRLIYSRDDQRRAIEEIKISNHYEDLKDFYDLRLKTNLEEAKKDLGKGGFYAG